MRKTATLISASLLIICFSCFAYIKSDDYDDEAPAGTVKITDTLYYDATEVSNADWKEYMFWIGKVFGKSSDEYKAAIPDTLVWSKRAPCLSTLSDEYFIHPEYINYPLVGVTQKQAEDFTKWRSDRMFEKILIGKKLIKEYPNQNRQNYFTIQKYFDGQYQGVKPHESVKYYPNYRLPSIQEWRQAVKYEDSIENKYVNHKTTSNIGIEPCKKLFQRVPTLIEPGNVSKKAPISNLRGNVSEWASEKNISIGGGWADKEATLAVQDTFHVIAPNAWTGFRNVCEWKEYRAR